MAESDSERRNASFHGYFYAINSIRRSNPVVRQIFTASRVDVRPCPSVWVAGDVGQIAGTEDTEGTVHRYAANTVTQFTFPPSSDSAEHRPKRFTIEWLRSARSCAPETGVYFAGRPELLRPVRMELAWAIGACIVHSSTRLASGPGKAARMAGNDSVAATAEGCGT